MTKLLSINKVNNAVWSDGITGAGAALQIFLVLTSLRSLNVGATRELNVVG